MKKIVYISMLIIFGFGVTLIMGMGRDYRHHRGYHHDEFDNYHRGYHMEYGYGHCYGDTEYITNELELTKDQKREIARINDEYRIKYNKNVGNDEVLWKLHEEHEKKVKKILTDKQLLKLDKLHYDREYMHGHGWRNSDYKERGCW